MTFGISNGLEDHPQHKSRKVVQIARNTEKKPWNFYKENKRSGLRNFVKGIPVQYNKLLFTGEKNTEHADHYPLFADRLNESRTPRTLCSSLKIKSQKSLKKIPQSYSKPLGKFSYPKYCQNNTLKRKHTQHFAEVHQQRHWDSHWRSASDVGNFYCTPESLPLNRLLEFTRYKRSRHVLAVHNKMRLIFLYNLLGDGRWHSKTTKP